VIACAICCTVSSKPDWVLPPNVAAVAISTAAMMTWVSTALKAVSSRAAGWSSIVSFFSTTDDCW
jgi:hypothetical protein